MKSLRILITSYFTICLLSLSFAQGNIHEQSSEYVWPTDQQVVKKLKDWQDLKFGVLIHWGLYAVPGIVESWSICDEDWITRDTTLTYQQYMDWYFSLADEFCPTQFNPSQWASICQDAGMRYMIFTTKHHDGFCMFDSHETDFSIAHHAFRNHPKRDVLQHVLQAFKEKDFSIGTYFSKPDWHSQLYWWDVYGKKGRNVNYPIKQHPERWKRFQQFTYRQIEEILSRYGNVDILWLDGGWVCPENRGQDINMPSIAQMARKHQPGILIVDRTIHGPYENYQTPERTIPEKQLNYPWESCIPLSDDWGYVKKPHWKSAQKVINTLIEIVAKGGNMVLGVGPTPEGIIEPAAEERLREIGKWLRQNGKAIFNTVPTLYYHEGNVWFTQSKDGKQLYALYPLQEGKNLPTELSWNCDKKIKSARLLSTNKRLKTKYENGRLIITLPKNIPQQPLAIEVCF